MKKPPAHHLGQTIKNYLIIKLFSNCFGFPIQIYMNCYTDFLTDNKPIIFELDKP